MTQHDPRRLTTSFRKSRVIGPLHMSGPVSVSTDAQRIVTCVRDKPLLTDLATGDEVCRFATDSTAATALAITPDGNHLAAVFSSLSIRIYSLPPPLSSPFSKPLHPIRVIPKAHDAPVHVITVDPSSHYLATGSADGVVKVWDIHRGFVTHVFKGHGGIISALTFHLCRANGHGSDTTTRRLLLATGSVDTRLRIFDLTSSASRATNAKPLLVLEGHLSVPRGLAFSADDRWLISGGRDAVVLVWHLQNCLQTDSQAKKRKEKDSSSFLAKTIPVLERIEALGIIEPTETIGSSTGASNLRFYTGGENGVVRIWDAKDNQVLAVLGEDHSERSEDAEEQLSILDVIYAPGASTLVSIHADQNVLFHSLQSLSLSRQLIGFNDEIVDAVFLSSDSPSSTVKDTHLAIATNSPLIRVYSLSASSGLDARLISGHGDTVLTLGHSQDRRIFASGSKDKSARIWAPFADGSGAWGCIAVCEGHAESVGALAMSHNWAEKKGRFLFTGSQDRTIKMWDLDALPLTCPVPPSAEGAFEPLRPRSPLTQKAHDKDINSLDISPNDKLLATGSQDKTAKIFEIDVSSRGASSIKLIGTLKGHKRGVWNVKFSRTDRIVATSSGDKSIKLWNLEDFSCLKTFEGHTNSVLRVEFINHSQQLLSTASDGLLKLWNVRQEDCTASMDNHEDKIWALAVSSDERTVVTAAADSVITFWVDSTEEELLEKATKQAELVNMEQDLQNYLVLADYKNAILLALSMDQPRRLFTLFKAVSASRAPLDTSIAEDGVYTDASQTITGNAAVDQVIRTLPLPELGKLLRHIRDWNASSKTSGVAQTVLHAVLKLRRAEDVRAAFVTTSSNALPSLELDGGGDGDGDGDGNGNGDAMRPTQKAARAGDGLREVVEALIPYTERHLARTERMVQDSYVLDFLIGEMDGGVVLDEDGMEVDI